MNKVWRSLLLLALLIGLDHAPMADARCNEILCASVVSKCMLTRSCKCEISRDPQKCTCCVECAICLGNYYQRCCTCLGMCEEKVMELDPNDSQVGDIINPFYELFDAITKDYIEKVKHESWLVEWDTDKLKNKLNVVTLSRGKDLGNNRVQVNCSIAYLPGSISAAKCREDCYKLGAGAYRFFFDGCCECVGATCPGYGSSKSQCLECSNIGTDTFDYGDGNDCSDNAFITNELEDKPSVENNNIMN